MERFIVLYQEPTPKLSETVPGALAYAHHKLEIEADDMDIAIYRAKYELGMKSTEMGGLLVCIWWEAIADISDEKMWQTFEDYIQFKLDNYQALLHPETKAVYDLE